MTSIEVRLFIKAPVSVVLAEFSDYKHAPVLHKNCVKSVQVLEESGNSSIALWRLKVLWFWAKSKQKQTVYPPDKMQNETIAGFARGTVENTMLSETNGGTQVLDIVEVKIPGLARLFEKVIAGYTRNMVTGILVDHKKDLEGRVLDSDKS